MSQQNEYVNVGTTNDPSSPIISKIAFLNALQ